MELLGVIPKQSSGNKLTVDVQSYSGIAVACTLSNTLSGYREVPISIMDTVKYITVQCSTTNRVDISVTDGFCITEDDTGYQVMLYGIV